MRSMLAVMVAALALLFGQGCTHWTVVKQANPNPFVGQKKFVLEEPSFDGLMVDTRTEADFKSGRSSEENGRWDADKKRVVEAFVAALRDDTHDLEWASEPGDAVLVRTHITNMHGGISAGIVSTAAHVAMTVQLLKGNEVLDEIVTAGEYSQNESIHVGGVATGGYSGSDRLGKAADKLGGYVASYLASRTSP